MDRTKRERNYAVILLLHARCYAGAKRSTTLRPLVAT